MATQTFPVEIKDAPAKYSLKTAPKRPLERQPENSSENPSTTKCLVMLPFLTLLIWVCIGSEHSLLEAIRNFIRSGQLPHSLEEYAHTFAALVTPLAIKKFMHKYPLILLAIATFLACVAAVLWPPW